MTFLLIALAFNIPLAAESLSNYSSKKAATDHTIAKVMEGQGHLEVVGY